MVLAKSIVENHANMLCVRVRGIMQRGPMLASLRSSCVRTIKSSPLSVAAPRRLCSSSAGGGQSSLLQHLKDQIQSEIAGSTRSKVHMLGFYGALCNWFLGISAVYDASMKGPEVISLKMTGVMLCYSSLFATWAGWAVMPRNFILAGSHIFNVVAQSNQLRRCLEYQIATVPGAKAEIAEMGTKAAMGMAGVGIFALSAGRLRTMAPAALAGPGGPFTIHPWPPMTKLMISGASLLELDRPTEKISLSQYSALTVTGSIFTFYGLAVTPINYPLTAVNILLFLSSGYHLSRKIKADYL